MLLSCRRDVVLAVLVFAVPLLMATWPNAAAAAPVRLGAAVDGNSGKAGCTTQVILTFIDGSFKSVANDRPRTVLFEIRSTRGGNERNGDIAPTRANVPAGVKSYAAARFSGRAAGTVLVRATSDGLARRGRARVSGVGLVEPLVPCCSCSGTSVAATSVVRLLPSSSRFRLNGVSYGQFSISVDRGPSGKNIDYRVMTRRRFPSDTEARHRWPSPSSVSRQGNICPTRFGCCRRRDQEELSFVPRPSPTGPRSRRR